ncbi:MAG: hypothetical protein IKB16_03865 [Lentisphaeria bacterium]|nr:hypothetical protein [Lentisphaeria bacterium]
MLSYKKTISLIMLGLCATQLKAAEYGTFESFYSSGGLAWWEWGLIIAGTIAVGVLTFITWGGTAPAWMVTVGTWIGSTIGLHGIAAANFGLALLGGGAVAAGGLGVAGGVAVLTAAMTFGVETTLSYGTDIALEKWNQAKFVEANKEMLTLPLPRNKKGGIAYRTAINYLKENLKENKEKGIDISTPENQHVLKRASEILYEKMQSEKDKDYILKNKTLLALLYFQTNNYSKASKEAQEAMILADEIREKRTMSSYIWAISEIANPEKNCTKETIQALRIAYYHEPDYELIPIMTACAMDRFMYRYHYGELSIDHMRYFLGIITNQQIDKKLSAVSLEIFVTRCLVELKRTKQDIYIVTKDESMMGDKKIVDELRNRFERHKDLVSMLQKNALPIVYKLQDKFPKESKTKPELLTSLLNNYFLDLAKLEKQIQYKQYDIGPAPKKEEEDTKNNILYWILGGIAILMLTAFGSLFYIKKRRKTQTEAKNANDETSQPEEL